MVASARLSVESEQIVVFDFAEGHAGKRQCIGGTGYPPPVRAPR